MPIANPPKMNVGKMEFCQCSHKRLNGWPVNHKDQYCSECGSFLYSLNFLCPSMVKGSEIQQGYFLFEQIDDYFQIRSNLQISKNTTDAKKDIKNSDDISFSFCKEAEIVITKTNKIYFLSLNDNSAKNEALSFSLHPRDTEDFKQELGEPYFKEVIFKCYKNRNGSEPILECVGILGPLPKGNPFEIFISDELPKKENDCLKWLFTAPNLDRLDISWKARYPFRLLGVYHNDGQLCKSFEKKDYVTGEKGHFPIKLKENGHSLSQFKFKVNVAGVDKATSIFKYTCLVEKVTSDIISLIPAYPDCKIPIKSGGTTPYDAIVILKKKSGYDLQITDIRCKDIKSCVKLITLLPLSVKNERTPLQFSIQTAFFDRVKDTISLYPVELVISDNKGNKWIQKLHLTLIREELLDHYLAIDWGTTNTCCTISDPRTGIFKQLTDHGKKYIPAIPSRFAIRKVDIEKKEYDLIVGSADSLKTDFQGRPECIISSLKRKFYDDPPDMQVIDANQNYFTIPTMDLVVQYLQALIITVEEKSPFEFKKIGFSYPTKIKKKHYTKLIDMLKKLEQSLQKVKPGISVTTLPNYLRAEEAKNQVSTPAPNFKEDNNNQNLHTPDEASAVAIEYCNSNDIKISGGSQILVVYDFGGGTIDSAVIGIFHDGKKFCSKLIGISGSHEFGGDDITNAMVQLVREKLFKIDPKVYIPIFDERTKKDSTDIGKKNRAFLFDIMEKHKKDFKSSGDKETPISFLGYLTQIKNENGKSANELFFKDSAEPTPTQKNNLQFFPSEIYDYEFALNNGTNSGLKIRQIIERSVEDLQNICDIEQIKPSKVILAGQGCNLPLVQDIFNKRFPGIINFDTDKAKTRLSVGLSQFLNSSDTNNDGIFAGNNPTPLVNHFTLGFKDKNFLFKKLIDIGTFLHTSNIKDAICFSFELPCNPNLDLFRKNYRNYSDEKIGTFDFRNAETLEEYFPPDFFKNVKVIQGFPEDASGIAKGRLFFRDFNDIFLVFSLKNQYYGCFKMKCSSDYFDLQDAVQGR